MDRDTLNRISSMIKVHMSRGLPVDSDTISFIKSAYGIDSPEQADALIENGDDGGSVIDMVSFPPDSFRLMIEESIPLQGFSLSEIQNIENLLCSDGCRTFIVYNQRKIFLTEEDSSYCYRRFLKRLNLDISFNFLAGINTCGGYYNIYSVRSLLRKKKFVSNDENCMFVNNLIQNYNTTNNFFNPGKTAGTGHVALPDNPEVVGIENSASSGSRELIEMISISADLFNGSANRPYDILSGKKFFYENTISEIEEFNRMLRAYSMEFIMMKKIQPPVIAIDEARHMVTIIDRMTSIVYGTVIPSVINILEEL